MHLLVHVACLDYKRKQAHAPACSTNDRTGSQQTALKVSTH